MNQDDDLIVKPTTRITPDSNVSLIDPNMGDERSYLDNYDSYDSYIYGDADATVEDTIETMTVYDPTLSVTRISIYLAMTKSSIAMLIRVKRVKKPVKLD